MDRENRRSQSGGRNSQNNNSRRLRNYENDYTPHYSGQGPDGNQARGSQPRGNRPYGNQSYGSGAGGHNGQRPEHMQQGSGQRKSSAGRKKNKHLVGRILAVIQGILSLVLLGILFIMDMIPMKYLLVVALLLLILWVFAFFSQFTRQTHIAGKVESVLLSVLLAAGCYYLTVTNSFLGNITAGSVRVDHMIIAVLKDNPAQNLSDVSDYVFGIQTVMDAENTEKTLAQVQENLGKDVEVKMYEGINQQVNGLYSGEVGAVIYNEALIDTVLEEHPTFKDDVRVLDNVKIETKVEVVKSDKKISKEPFTIYLSGTDSYSMSDKSRSDVNILATVNPETKQILLTTTPRDYYVEFPGVTNGTLDKLTHSGNYGVQCSMDTLAQLYGIEIDHYAKVNFTAVVQIVDLLGGIEVESDVAFTAFDGEYFAQGINELNGKRALSFVRERKAFAGGDNQRGKNQQKVIAAIFKKAISPAILANYGSLLGSLEGNFVTSMTTNDITELIKMQLNDGGEWNIVSQSVVGSNGNDYCYSLGGNAYVMIPDMESVNAARAQMQRVIDGEILSDIQ